ncbi:MAG: type III secretion system translocon subunit SctE [Opitutaceae bacterium]
MNPPGITQTPTIANTLFDPGTMLGEVADIKQNAIQALQASFKMLATVGPDGSPSTSQADGLVELEKPSFNSNVNDITLRIGLLQDALNQLMAQVSKTEIKQRMDELQKENQRQLERFEEQMAKAAEAAEKNKEAEKKGNIFEAVSNWIQAVVSIVSAVVTLISAAAQILTNPVGAGALIVAGVALIGAAAVQVTLAIDATMRAAGKEGFLSEADRTKMNQAVEILGYIALAGSMIGLVGGIVVALGQAGKAAGGLAAKEITKAAAAKLVATGMKESMTKTAQATSQAIPRYAMYAFKEAMAPLTRLGAQMAVIQIIGQGTNQVAGGVINHEIADIKGEASALLEEADLAEAAAAALEAAIAKLRAMIEQLQSELEKLVDDFQQTMAVIFGAIDESANSMTNVIQSTTY